MADNMINNTNDNDIIMTTKVNGADKSVKDLVRVTEALKNLQKEIQKYTSAINVSLGKSDISNIKLTKSGYIDRRTSQGKSLTTGLQTYNENNAKTTLNLNKQLLDVIIKLQNNVNTLSQINVKRLELSNSIKNATLSDSNYQQLVTQQVKLQAQEENARLIAKKENLPLLKQNKQLEQEINKSLKQNTNEINKQKTNTQSLLSQIMKIGAKIYVVRRLVSLLNYVVKDSGSWTENLNLFAVTFGENYQETLDWATDFAKRLGVSNNEIVKMTGLFKQLSTSIGMADDLSDSLSQTLTQLAYDFASYYNVEKVSTVREKLQSGIFSGQIRTLRTLGIDVSAESINTFLKQFSQFAGITNNQLSQMQKVLVRTIITLQAGSNAYGDMTRSITSLYNRQRIFVAQIDNLKLALGDLVSNYISDFIAGLNGIIKAMTDIIRVFKPLQEELSYDIGENIFTEITDDVEEAQNSLGLLSFDKFESLKDSSTGSESLYITEQLTKLLEQQQAIYEQTSAQFSGIDELTQKIYNNIMKWAFPLSTINEETGEFQLNTEVVNQTLQNIPELFEIIKKIAGEIFNIMGKISPTFGKVLEFIINIISQIVTLLDKLDLLDEVIIALIALNIASKINKLLTYFNSFTMVLTTIITLVGIIVSYWNDMSAWQKATTIIGALVVTVSALAVAFGALKGWAGVLTTAGAITAGIGLIAGSIKLSQIEGYANGGIPKKSELFYMNENGIPETLINTGGTQTNVINIQQLKEGMKQGFVQAINETGLLNAMQSNIVLDGRNIDNNTIARGLFNALKVESKRRGGNQL